MNATADAIQGRLDQGKIVLLYKNELGSYTAIVVPDKFRDRIGGVIRNIPRDGAHITDHFTVTESLAALAEKV